MNALIQTVIDLDSALGGSANLILGGGLGLYLKQEHLAASGVRTRLHFDRLPISRTTQDIDLFLRAEVIANRSSVERYRRVLDALGFKVVRGSEWLKFARQVGGTEVLLDLMVGPLGEHESKVRLKDSRVRPATLSGKDGFHAFLAEEAIGIEVNPLRLTLPHAVTQASAPSCSVLIPLAFPYALMKLGALRDRINDPDKQEGRHHAMDLYRIVGLLTEEEERASVELARGFAGHPMVAEGMKTVDSLLAPKDGIGRLRLLEYERLNRSAVPEVDPDLLVDELRRLLTAPQAQ